MAGLMRIQLRSSLPLTILAGCAAIAIAGCGGGDDSPSTTASSTVSGATGANGAATPLSQEDFVSQGNMICADVNTQLAALEPPTDDTQSIATYAAAGLAIVDPAMAEFQALTPPADLQAKYDAYLALVAKQIETQEALQAAAAAGDAESVKSRISDLQAQNSDQAATDLGLTECANDS